MCQSGSSVDVVDLNKELAKLPFLAKIPRTKQPPEVGKARDWFGGKVTEECEHMKEVHAQEQIRIIVLVDHIQNCTHQGGNCPEFGEMCQRGKALKAHMRKCNAQGHGMWQWKSQKSRAKCNDPNCWLVRSIYAHFENCTFQSCDVCPRARMLIRELRHQRKRRRSEGRSEDERNQKKSLTESKRKPEED